MSFPLYLLEPGANVVAVLDRSDQEDVRRQVGGSPRMLASVSQYQLSRRAECRYQYLAWMNHIDAHRRAHPSTHTSPKISHSRPILPPDPSSSMISTLIPPSSAIPSCSAINRSWNSCTASHLRGGVGGSAYVVPVSSCTTRKSTGSRRVRETPRCATSPMSIACDGRRLAWRVGSLVRNGRCGKTEEDTTGAGGASAGMKSGVMGEVML